MNISKETIQKIIDDETNLFTACRRVTEALEIMGFRAAGCHLFEESSESTCLLLAGYGALFAGARMQFASAEELLDYVDRHSGTVVLGPLSKDLDEEQAVFAVLLGSRG